MNGVDITCPAWEARDSVFSARRSRRGYAGLSVCVWTTHGLGPRGGMVESFVRIGGDVDHTARAKRLRVLILALERTVALRAWRPMQPPEGSALFDHPLAAPGRPARDGRRVTVET